MNKSRLLRITILSIALFGMLGLWANNLQITNVGIERFPTDDYALVSFDVSWDNSWRTNVGPANWDAAWIFVKYRRKETPTAAWSHATLHWVDGTGTPDGHTVPAGGLLESAGDNGNGGSYGVFLHSATEDMGLAPSVDYSGTALRWDYGEDGLSDGDSVEICVLGIEMVFVPEGDFVLGAGGTEFNRFYTFPSTISPYSVSSESQISVGTTDGYLYYDGAGDQMGPIPAAFPKGHAAFYCMKYEITQGQYADFLNRLSMADANIRDLRIDNGLGDNGGGGFRSAYTGTWPSITSDNEFVACNYLSWADLAAYLDWAALRPMTELEYEKVCRGTLPAVPNEYAWGSTDIVGADVLENAGAANEQEQGNDANAVYGFLLNVAGPMRVGALGQGVDTRTGTGASYYGIMELSGNVWERPVTVGNMVGRAYTGLEGDGELMGAAADVVNWPDAAALGAGFRGGGWFNILGFALRVSDRGSAAGSSPFRSNLFGGRGVRCSSWVRP